MLDGLGNGEVSMGRKLWIYFFIAVVSFFLSGCGTVVDKSNVTHNPEPVLEENQISDESLERESVATETDVNETKGTTTQARNEYVVGWGTLALINAGLAQGKNRSGLNWFLISLLLGPLATLILLFMEKLPENNQRPLD